MPQAIPNLFTDTFIQTDTSVGSQDVTNTDNEIVKTDFNRILSIHDALLHIFSFLSLSTLQTVGASSKALREASNSCRLWNAHILNLKKYNPRLTISDYLKNEGLKISVNEKRALHIYLTVFKNLNAFLAIQSREKSEYEFELSQSGEITFLQKETEAPTYFTLVSKQSGKIDVVYSGVKDLYQNTESPQRNFHWGILRSNTASPNITAYKSDFLDEENMSTPYRCMYLFLRSLNTAYCQKKVQEQRLPEESFRDEVIGSCDDTLEAQRHTLQSTMIRAIPSVETATPRFYMGHEAAPYLIKANLCSPDIFRKLYFPSYTQKIHQGEPVVIETLPGTYVFAIATTETLHTSSENPQKEKEYVFYFDVQKGNTFYAHFYKASMVFRIPPKVLTEIVEGVKAQERETSSGLDVPVNVFSA